MYSSIKKYSANYSNTNHNFVIQNLDDEPIYESIYYSSICVIKNILQRGKPTLMSSFLQNKIGKIHEFDDFKKHKVLIDKKINSWQRLIKGVERTLFNPAKDFFDNFLDEILGEDCKFVKNLILPEVLICDITQENIEEFEDQQVDFYLPQAYLVIEIDGEQHETDKIQKDLDIKRDKYLAEHGIKVFRIPVHDIYNNSFDKIKNNLREYIIQHKILTLYKNEFISKIDIKNPIYCATSIMRYQILILELLKYGKLSLVSDKWDIELFDNGENSKELLELAIQDLYIWLACILRLQDISFKKPSIHICEIDSLDNFTTKNNVKIDFSLLKRYSDINQNYPDIYFVRTDYIDTYKYFENPNANYIKNFVIKQVDYFQIEIADLIKYKFKKHDDKIKKSILKYLVWNIFLQNDTSLNYKDFDFREGQFNIVKNILKRIDTIGLLPTGSGKSICYQIAGILQPAPSIVVAPIISLMIDQVDELSRFYTNRSGLISSNMTAFERTKILKDFAAKKYIFLFISPERFQDKNFRSELLKLPELAYAVIDEAHCLSEWGHDFRTSYLTLISTIRKYCNKNICLTALTATASLSVLKDLKLAMGIDDVNILTPLNYSRNELEFYVLDVKQNGAQACLTDKISKIINENENFATLIFTPYASKYDYGCECVCNKLQKTFNNKNIKFYSGKMDSNKKDEIQNGFKNDEFNILVATKAFGMGINKGNIKYTFHYGIPSSLEALYQEAGRAGRAKKIFEKEKAKCYILFSPEDSKILLNKIWDLETSRDELLYLSNYSKLHNNHPMVPQFEARLSNDVKRQLYFLQDHFIPLNDQLDAIKELYIHLQASLDGIIHCRSLKNRLFFGKNKKQEVEIKEVEKFLYRLYQLNIVQDWTINYTNQIIETQFNKDISETAIKEACQMQIQRYDSKFSFEVISDDKDYQKYNLILNENIDEFDKYVKIILEWAFDKFIGYRRQSLKNVYEACDKYLTQLNIEKIDIETVSKNFKRNIESYFTVNNETHKLLYLSENPLDISKVFELFYIYVDNKRTQQLKYIDDIRQLKNILMRLLEETSNNVSINLTSGLVRFLLNEFEDTDGKTRFKSALDYICKHSDQKQQQIILANILRICKASKNDTNNIIMAKTLFEYFEIEKYVQLVNKFLNDSFTSYLLTNYANRTLNVIMNNILK